MKLEIIYVRNIATKAPFHIHADQLYVYLVEATETLQLFKMQDGSYSLVLNVKCESVPSSIYFREACFKLNVSMPVQQWS